MKNPEIQDPLVVAICCEWGLTGAGINRLKGMGFLGDNESVLT